MSLELCILASGSSGNCALIRTPAGALVIDLGIGPRTCAKRLDGTGVQVQDVRAVCLTHLDSDHFRPHWAATLAKHQTRLFCHHGRKRHLQAALDPDDAEDLQHLLGTFDGKPFWPIEEICVTPIHLAHDAEGSHGFVIEGFGCRIGYATDLGRVPEALLEQFQQLDILAIECNYDPRMQVASARPRFLKQRIMGGRGHLSNEQCLEAVRAILDNHAAAGHRLPDHIVLLHRSRQCNCPRLVRRLFEQDPRIAPRLTLAEQYGRTDWLRRREIPPAAGEQLMLSWAPEMG